MASFFRLVTIYLAALLTYSCGSEMAGEFVIRDAPADQLAVIGFLGNHQRPILEVSAIGNFSASSFNPNVLNATPILWENDMPIDTFVYVPCVSCSSRLGGVYIGDTLTLSDEVHYRLTISAENFEEACVDFSQFRRVFEPGAVSYNDTIHIDGGVKNQISLEYRVVRQIDTGFINPVVANTRYGFLTTRNINNATVFNAWIRLDWRLNAIPGPFVANAINIAMEDLYYNGSPYEYEQLLQDSLLNYHAWVVYMTEDVVSGFDEYLNVSARESPGGVFVDQQLLRNNVENGFGYVVMADMVGGRSVFR